MLCIFFFTGISFLTIWCSGSVHYCICLGPTLVTLLLEKPFPMYFYLLFWVDPMTNCLTAGRQKKAWFDLIWLEFWVCATLDLACCGIELKVQWENGYCEHWIGIIIHPPVFHVDAVGLNWVACMRFWSGFNNTPSWLLWCCGFGCYYYYYYYYLTIYLPNSLMVPLEDEQRFY